MFSPSSITQTLDDAQQGLHAALTDVAENSLFAMVDHSDAATWRAGTCGSDGVALRAFVAFEGPFGGRLDLTVPEALARELGTAFVGHDAPDDMSPSDVEDFLGELANMTCGAWLTRSCPMAKFVLLPPHVWPFDGQDPAEDDVACEFYVAINDQPVRVRLSRDDGSNGAAR